MNAYFWDRDLRKHYFTGSTFNPLASLTDFKMLSKGDVRVLWSVLHVPEEDYFRNPPIRLLAHFTKGGRTMLKLNAWECMLRMMGEMESPGRPRRRRVPRSPAPTPSSTRLLAAGKRAIVHTVEGGHVISAGPRRRTTSPAASRGWRSSPPRRRLDHDRPPLPQRPRRPQRVHPARPAQDPLLAARHRGRRLRGPDRSRRGGGREDGGAADRPRRHPLLAGRRASEIYKLVGDEIPIVATHIGVQSAERRRRSTSTKTTSRRSPPPAAWSA